jgi:hypothetical protein
VRQPAANAHTFDLHGAKVAPSRRRWRNAALSPIAIRPALSIESVNNMNEVTPGTTFRGLPLTIGQDREIRHYIHAKERNGEQWDTPELKAMLADMLDPPEVVDDDGQTRDDSMAAECATAQGEESLDTDKLQSHRSC